LPVDTAQMIDLSGHIKSKQFECVH